MVVFIAVAVLIVVVALYVEGRRRDALADVAAEIGFAFTGGQHPLPDTLDQAGFYLFTQGQPLILNRLDGERDGYRVSLFGFGYLAGMGDEASRALPTADVGQIENRLQTIVWLQRPGSPLPDFDLSPTGQPIRPVGGRFGLLPVTFDGRDDFRKEYMLLGRDDAAMRRVFTSSAIDGLVADSGWFIEGRGDQWLVYRLFDRVPAEQIETFLDRAIRHIDQLQHR